MMILQLAQEAAAEPGRLLGFTANEWLLLIPFLVAAIVNVIQAVKGSKDGKKLRAAIEAIEETAAAHPEALDLTKRKAREKATQLGVQTGIFGLKDDVSKMTRRLEKPKE